MPREGVGGPLTQRYSGQTRPPHLQGPAHAEVGQEVRTTLNLRWHTHKVPHAPTVASLGWAGDAVGLGVWRHSWSIRPH